MFQNNRGCNVCTLCTTLNWHKFEHFCLVIFLHNFLIIFKKDFYVIIEVIKISYVPPICRGICIRYKAIKPHNGKRYAIGQKRCKSCEIFIKWDGLWCPCCGYRLRMMPQHTKHREEVRSSKMVLNN